MDQFEEKLNRHIDKVLELQRNKETKPLSLEELKEVDLSLGMTEEEWEAMMLKAEEFVQLAKSHYQYSNYVEAYKAAESAVAINPYHQEALLVLSNSALGKYEKDQKNEFLQKAEEHANDLLKVNPREQSAIQILARVRQHMKSENQLKKNLIKYGIVGVVIVLFFAGYFIFRPKPEPKQDTKLKFELIEAHENANAAWAQVENVIARRDQLLPQLLELAPVASLEMNTLKSEIESLKNQLDNTQDQDSKIEINNQLQDKIKQLMNAISKGNTNEKTELIMVQVEGSYNRITVEAQRYNELVRNYNILVKKHGVGFPEFKEKPYFQGK
jgi:LemA protein